MCKLADATKEPENVLVVTHGCWLMCFLDWLAANPSVFELISCDVEKRMSSPLNTSTTKLIIHKKSTGDSVNEEEKRKLEFFQIHDVAHLIAAKIIGVENPESE